MVCQLSVDVHSSHPTGTWDALLGQVDVGWHSGKGRGRGRGMGLGRKGGGWGVLMRGKLVGVEVDGSAGGDLGIGLGVACRPPYIYLISVR